METTEKKAALGYSEEVLQGQAPAGLAQKGEAASARTAKGRLWDWAKPLYLLALGYRTRENKQRELLSDILFGALCWVFSVTHGLFGAYPFALSLLAATPKRVLPCYLGALLGCCFMGKVGLLYIVVYSAVPLFRLLLSYPSKRRLFPSFVFFGEEPPLRVLVAASAGLGMAVYECVVAGVFTYTLLFSLAAILLPSLLTFFYIGALDFGVDLSYLLGKGEKGKGAHESEPFFRVSLLVFLYTVALALSRYALFGISLGGCFAAGVTLLASRRYGALWGCAVGLAVSLSGNILFVPSYCLLGLCAGLLWQVSMPCALSAAAIASGAYAVYAGGLSGFLGVVPEVAVTSLLSWPLLNRLPPFRSSSEERALGEKASAVEEKEEKPPSEAPVARLSAALYNLSGIRQSLDEKEDEEGYFLLAARTRERHCRPCESKKGCKHRGESETLLVALAESLRRGEPFSPENTEKIRALSTCCGHFSQMLGDLQAGAALIEERRHRFPARRLLLSDYALLSRMLNEISDEGRRENSENGEEGAALSAALEALGYRAEGVRVYGRRRKTVRIARVNKGGRAVSAEALRAVCAECCGVPFSMPRFVKSGGVKEVLLEAEPRFSVRVAYASLAKSGEEPSGDALRSFENKEGYYYTLLCDGMGTGREAAGASDRCAYFLSELLKAGGRMTPSLRLLNNFVQAEGEEGTVTVDLCEIDLFSGGVTFLKSGAAPSFLKRGKSLFRIRSRTVPLGLFGAPDSERINVEIEAGDRIILLSDGIIEKEENEALRAALALEGESPKGQADAILATAPEGDDRSVAVLEISHFTSA